MMIMKMDRMPVPSSRERAQRFYEKNIELENKRRNSAQARVDLNTWQQIRENYEAIVLEDHGFSEKHNIEYVLWQFHYRRIEELRAHLTAASSAGAKVPARPDRIAKIRLQFKTFLSEATGFYHDLILKIRSKYGLPLGYFSEDSDSRVIMEKDGKKSADMRKGLISCHRCLIYLGDLARYKGLYGDGDSKARDHAAASSYYLQAASLWPLNGNPHHQLAILASYSGDELVAIYRYFRSLAVDNPFSTARDNLIVAFEKNRHSYTQLTGEVKTTMVKDTSARLNKGRGKGEAKPAVNDANLEANAGKPSSIQDIHKSFCIRFVRLNGILFTRTSLETFAEVFSSVSSEFCLLLSSGLEEELNFGADVGDNALFIVRLISILIFTVHNVKKEAEGQTYAEIVQHAVLLQNSYTAVFDLMGHIMKRFVQLRDPSSSYLLPGILVFMEWLACCPDVVSGSDADEKQVAIRLIFWNHCTSFLNKVLSFWSKSLDDNEDDTCFYKMTHYEEGETGNRLALWEDFELRGFSPLLPAQTILDFSRKHSFGSEGSKEKVARVKRILAAGKALANVARIDQKTMFYDSRMKKFVIGMEPQVSDNEMLTFDSDFPKTNGVMQEIQAEETVNIGVLQPSLQSYVEGDEEDEVILFRPAVVEKQNDIPNLALHDGIQLNPEVLTGDMKFYNGSIPAPLDTNQQAIVDAASQKSVSYGINTSQHIQPIQPHSSKWLMEDAAALANSLKAVRFMENGHSMKHDHLQNLGTANAPTHSMSVYQPASMNSTSVFYNQTQVPDLTPLKDDSVASYGFVPESLPVKMSATAPAASRKSPVSRPVRHLGPPPGFSQVPFKTANGPGPRSDLTNENSLADDYSWLQLPSSRAGSVLNNVSVTSQAMPQFVNSSNGLGGTASFPFPGKQLPFQNEKQKGWQNYQALEHVKLQQEQQMQQQLLNGNQQFIPIPGQYHGKSWGGRYIV